MRDQNHNDIEPNAMFVGDPEAVRENGRKGRRRRKSSDSVTVDYSSKKRRRMVNEVPTSSADEATADEAPAADENCINDDKALSYIPTWMRSSAMRRYRFDESRTLQTIIEVSLNYYSDDEIIDDDNNAVISSTDDGFVEDVDMLDTDDDENGMCVDEAMEEENLLL